MEINHYFLNNSACMSKLAEPRIKLFFWKKLTVTHLTNPISWALKKGIQETHTDTKVVSVFPTMHTSLKLRAILILVFSPLDICVFCHLDMICYRLTEKLYKLVQKWAVCTSFHNCKSNNKRSLDVPWPAGGRKRKEKQPEAGRNQKGGHSNPQGKRGEPPGLSTAGEGASTGVQLLMGLTPYPGSSQQSETGVKCQLSKSLDSRLLGSQQLPHYWITVTHTHVC